MGWLMRTDRSLACLLASIVLANVSHAQEKPRPDPIRFSKEGRVLYANDDDWDWASPLNSREPCGLAVYGKMPWSALDWMEEGLGQVRGVLVGVPPLIGNYLTMADLNRVRPSGPKRSYEQLEHRANILRDLLRDRVPPNVIILMQDSGPARPPITDADAEAAWDFVKKGGRLIILDDWGCYHALMAPFLDKKRLAPRKPEEPLDAKLVAAVEERVKLLGSEDFKTREKAFNELVKMGPRIVPILEKARAPNLEAERRVQRLDQMLRPPPVVIAADEWLKHALATAREIHKHAEVRTITRDGPMTPGVALLIRMVNEK